MRESVRVPLRRAAERAAADSDVDITVHTRDSWTLRPTATYTSGSGLSLGFQDRDVLGTGKTFGLSEVESSIGRGGSINATDPWLFGTPFIGAAQVADLGRVHQFSVSARTHVLTVDQPWVVAAIASKWVRENKARDTSTEAVDASFRVGRIVEASIAGVSRLWLGAELDSLATMASIDSGARSSPRRFFGPDVELQRQTAVYDTLSWLVPGRGLLDVPIGTEGDGLVAVGPNGAAPGYPWAARYDTWVGRMWLPGTASAATLARGRRASSAVRSFPIGSFAWRLQATSTRRTDSGASGSCTRT